MLTIQTILQPPKGYTLLVFLRDTLIGLKQIYMLMIKSSTNNIRFVAKLSNFITSIWYILDLQHIEFIPYAAETRL